MEVGGRLLVPMGGAKPLMMLLSQGDNLKPPIIYSCHVERTLDIRFGIVHEILKLFCEASSLAVLQVS